MSEKRTLFEKFWDEHVVSAPPGQSPLLYIDLHLVHEVTSPQAFDGLRAAGRKVRQPHRTVATVDHNVPTTPRGTPITDPIAARQIQALQQNCKEFGVRLYDISSAEQGIVHVIGPELGLTQPGMTIVCGDSHTSTHGAFGALAFGIGTSEVEHVLATQCLQQSKPRTMKVEVSGTLPEGVSAKDLALAIIGQIGTDGATAHVIEYTGEAVRALSMEGRMTLCNMSIEDLRAAARVVRGYRINKNVQAMVVPGSQAIKRAAEAEGLDRIFLDAGFEWRESGCSMCLGMNPDILQPGERCASTSNRNFEGRQGKGGRTHLVSPVVAAATAVLGRFASPSELGVPLEVG